MTNTFPAWSPDGCRLVFLSNRDGSTLHYGPGDDIPIYRLYVMNADGSDQRVLLQSPADGLSSWSPNGRTITFASGIDYGGRGGPPTQIAVVGANGRNRRQLTRDANTGYSFGSVDPTWSPNGRKLAFVSDREEDSNGFDQIYVMNADGSRQRKLTRNPGTLHLQYPTWSPDGQKIAFSSGRNEPPVTDQIFVINSDGSDRQQLTRVGHNLFPTWSPDGQKVAYMCAREGPPVTSRICLMNADGSNQRQLTSSGVSGFPRWSPDGQTIAFVVARGGGSQVYVMNSDGGRPRSLTHK